MGNANSSDPKNTKELPSNTDSTNPSPKKRKKIVISTDKPRVDPLDDIPSFYDEDMTESTQDQASDVFPVVFKWAVQDPTPSKVEICGAWDGWSQKTPLNEKTDGQVQTTLHLKQGTYEFKFIVDDNWCIDPNLMTKMNVDGIQNNIVVVEQGEFSENISSESPAAPPIEVKAEAEEESHASEAAVEEVSIPESVEGVKSETIAEVAPEIEPGNEAKTETCPKVEPENAKIEVQAEVHTSEVQETDEPMPEKCQEVTENPPEVFKEPSKVTEPEKSAEFGQDLEEASENPLETIASSASEPPKTSFGRDFDDADKNPSETATSEAPEESNVDDKVHFSHDFVTHEAKVPENSDETHEPSVEEENMDVTQASTIDNDDWDEGPTDESTPKKAPTAPETSGALSDTDVAKTELEEGEIHEDSGVQEDADATQNTTPPPFEEREAKVERNDLPVARFEKELENGVHDESLEDGEIRDESDETQVAQKVAEPQEEELDNDDWDDESTPEAKMPIKVEEKSELLAPEATENGHKDPAMDDEPQPFLENDDWSDDEGIPPPPKVTYVPKPAPAPVTSQNGVSEKAIAEGTLEIDTKSDDEIKEDLKKEAEKAAPPPPPRPPTPAMKPEEFDLEFLKGLFEEADGHKLLFDDIKHKYKVLAGHELLINKLNDLLGTKVKTSAAAFTQHRPKVFKTEFTFTARLMITYLPEEEAKE